MKYIELLDFCEKNNYTIDYDPIYHIGELITASRVFLGQAEVIINKELGNIFIDPLFLLDEDHENKVAFYRIKRFKEILKLNDIL